MLAQYFLFNQLAAQWMSILNFWIVTKMFGFKLPGSSPFFIKPFFLLSTFLLSSPLWTARCNLDQRLHVASIIVTVRLAQPSPASIINHQHFTNSPPPAWCRHFWSYVCYRSCFRLLCILCTCTARFWKSNSAPRCREYYNESSR